MSISSTLDSPGLIISKEPAFGLETAFVVLFQIVSQEVNGSALNVLLIPLVAMSIFNLLLKVTLQSVVSKFMVHSMIEKLRKVVVQKVKIAELMKRLSKVIQFSFSPMLMPVLSMMIFIMLVPQSLRTMILTSMVNGTMKIHHHALTP